MQMASLKEEGSEPHPAKSAGSSAADSAAAPSTSSSSPSSSSSSSSASATTGSSFDSSAEKEKETKHAEEDDDDDEEEEKGAGAAGAAGAAKKKKKKKKKKAAGAGGGEEKKEELTVLARALGKAPAGVSDRFQSVGFWRELLVFPLSFVGHTCVRLRLYSLAPDAQTKVLRNKHGSAQTSPPTIPVCDFFQSGVFPEGQILQYAQNFNTFRTTDQEKKDAEKLDASMYNEVRCSPLWTEIGVGFVCLCGTGISMQLRVYRTMLLPPM